ncbi:MAG TPA: M1 family aminopeptidase [Kofleriaceae bacterium]|nr:M1 family aminopeptidase [Kofleriaceae bacterium]
MRFRGLFLLSVATASCSGAGSAPPVPPPRSRPAAAPAPATPAADGSPMRAPGLRLGDDVQPIRYALDLTLVPERDHFTGRVDVEVRIARETDAIVLHADELTIESASVVAGGEEVAARPVLLPPDFVGLALARPVGPGVAHLRMSYRGALDAGETDGLYVDVDGGQRYIYTQFEALDARRAFPCFDEPRFKVPWTVTLHVKKEHLALANSPQVSESEEAGGMKVVRFAESKPMPSYLVALAVGPFDVVDAGVAGRNRTPVRIITPRGQAGQARWAAQTTGPILEELEAYFDSPYPYEKLDSIAVPHKGGAMENPGLITYGSSLILARAEDDTVARRRSYAGICAHELAHMWFGDLVTMAWWDDLWLNEAFATWMARRTIQAWKPAWGADMTRIQDRSTAMTADSLLSARRVRQPIATRDEIESGFDRITYEKGASVIAMFERWMGREQFQRGVRRYLAKHAWKNATAEDFLAALSAEAGRDVAPAFSTFLDQPGVPLVTAGLECAPGKPPVVSLAQSRYLPAGSQASAAGAQRWQVPVCVGHPKGVECTLLTEETGELVLAKAKSCPAWIQANAGMNGYYRVAYRGDLWQRLGRAWNKLPAGERLGMMSDLRALVVSGQVKVGDALAQLPARVAGADRHLLKAMIEMVESVDEILPGEDLRPAWATWVRETFGRRARALGWRVRRGDSEEVRLTRPTLVELVADLGDDRALGEEAVRLARRWLDDRSAVHPDVIDQVLAVAAHRGDRALLDRMRAAALKTQDRKERTRIIKGMGAFRDPAALRAALDTVLSTDFDMREARHIYDIALEDPRTRAIAWSFVAEKLDAIAARLPRNSRVRMVALGDHFCDPERRAEVQKLFASRGQGERVTAQTLEKIDLCSAQRETHAASLRGFLAGERAPRDVARPPGGARRTKSGLRMKVLKRGAGTRHPGPTSKVEVHYTGWTTDGVMFDSSRQRGQPATFPLDAVIPGWTEGVQLMVEGERARLWIPEDLAYKGKPGRPAGMLVFDVELLRIVD